MRFFPCLFSSPRAEAVDKLYDQHRVRRAASSIRPVPRVTDNPYAGAPLPNRMARRIDDDQARKRSEPARDDGFDATGFMLGYATGVPISPSQGISAGAMIGAAMHQNNQAPLANTSTNQAPLAAVRSDPDPAPSPSCDTSSSSSGDSGSSSSSCDSGSSGGGGGD